jgi:hypothetical protein
MSCNNNRKKFILKGALEFEPANGVELETVDCCNNCVHFRMDEYCDKNNMYVDVDSKCMIYDRTL